MLYHRDTVRAAAAAVSDDETRLILTGVHFDGRTVVATDGRILIALTEPDHGMAWGDFPKPPGAELTDASEPVTLPVKPLLESAKATPKKGLLPVLHCIAVSESAPGYRRIVATYLDGWQDGTARIIEGPYPNWRQVVSNGQDPKVAFGLTVDVVLKLFKALKAAGVETVSVKVADAMKGQLLEGTAANGATVTAVLMPCRLPEYGAVPPRA